MDAYPATRGERDRFILARRAPRPIHDAWRYHDLIVEHEAAAPGSQSPVVRVATVFLTGSECPWRCAMCDLWRYTLGSATPAGAIPAQLSAARAELKRRQEEIRSIKLYNASNFFDPHAVPESDYRAIAGHLVGIDTVVVESHPSLVGPQVDAFLAHLDSCREGGQAIRLEVAMGLETAHPQALEALHKQLTIEVFRAAAEGLRGRGVAVRVFLLISPPFVPPHQQDRWLQQSIETAVTAGASVIALIPTRDGNGTVEALAREGLYQPPRLHDIERSAALALGHKPAGCRVVIDIWELTRFADCGDCFDARRARLHLMNLEQRVLPSIHCARCGGSVAA